MISKPILNLINSIKRTIKLTSSYGKILSNTKGKLKAKFLEGEVYEGVTKIQHHGFKSSIPKGSTVFAVCNGDREKLLILASENKEKEPELEGTSLYFDKKSFINIKEGKLLIEAEGTKPFEEIREALSTLEGSLNSLLPFIATASPTSPPPVLKPITGNISNLKKLEG